MRENNNLHTICTKSHSPNNENDDSSSIACYDDDAKYVCFEDLFPSHYSISSRENERDPILRRAYVIGIITISLVLTALPALTYLAMQREAEPGDTLFFSAAIFTLFTVCLSVYEIVMHLTHWCVHLLMYLSSLLMLLPDLCSVFLI